MANQIQHKYDDFGKFVSICKKFVNLIQNYEGNDPLAPWYDYLLWFEENFVIDFKQESIFDQILAACLCRFENEERYKQDRRLIKLFIKFIHYQEQQDMHYDVMIASGVGSKVADLYINWAFQFDVNGNFSKADEIFRRGLSAQAEPLNLLKAAHEAFGYSMSQRMLYKSNEKFQRDYQQRMLSQLEEITALRIDGKHVKTPKSLALQSFNKEKLINLCIPNGIAAGHTPEKRHNLSVAQTIIDSARKMHREKSRRLGSISCRLDFNENACGSGEVISTGNLYEKGIQLGRNFKSKNQPQSQPPPIAYCDPSIGSFRGNMPGYDKIMLIPATNVAFSSDELKAYNWFKNRSIQNAFTKEQDKIWGVGYDIPIRWSNVFARENFPQSQWIVHRISPTDECNEKGPHRFMCNMTALYPKQSNEEFSLDEIIWQKRKQSTSKHTIQIPHKSGNKSGRVLDRTNSIENKLSPIVEMDLSGCDDALVEVPKRRECMFPPISTTVEANKKRKSSIFTNFDALNDTCTTQMFSNLLHSTAISTPKTKIPKFHHDDSVVAENCKEETKLKLFTDQSSSELSTDVHKSTENSEKSKSQPNDFGFAIYEDKTMTIHAIKNHAGKDKMNETSSGNKENIVLTENQSVNLEQSKTSGAPNKSETEYVESNVINSDAQQNEKQSIIDSEVERNTQQPGGFQFGIYTDKTETIKAVEKLHGTTSGELSVENKENIIDPANTNLSQSINQKQSISIDEEIATVNKMIESVLNSTKHEVVPVNDKSIFKEPPTPKRTSKRSEPVHIPNETTYFDILDTTEEFELLEAECANSPTVRRPSPDVIPAKLENSFAKSVMISAANKSCMAVNKSLNVSRFSGVHITEEEQRFIFNNPSVSDRTRLNWTRPYSDILPAIEEKEAKENDANENVGDIGKSIYVEQPELVFNEIDADWNEVTMFLADETATNEYKVEEINLDETRHRIDTHMLNLKDLNPFDPEVQKDVLTDIGFLDQLHGANNFNCVMMNIVHPLKPRSSIELFNKKYQIRKLIGTGAFGKVFSADCTKTKEMYAFKQQRPQNLWEYYVCLQIHSRIKDEHIRKGFMAVEFAVIGNNATIYASKFSKYGTIINVCNKVKQTTNKSIDECIVMILVKQMFTIMENFHKAKFIHADVKPDNFLLMDKLSMNYENPDIVLQLIDFGQSIDLSYFSNHVFWAKVKTENFVCTEMMEDKPWTFHCDLFCLASTIYTMVAGKYMVVTRRTPTDPYKPQKLPRYVNGPLWEEIFDKLINIPSLKIMPSLTKLQQLLDNELKAIGPKKVNEAILKFNKALD